MSDVWGYGSTHYQARVSFKKKGNKVENYLFADKMRDPIAAISRARSAVAYRRGEKAIIYAADVVLTLSGRTLWCATATGHERYFHITPVCSCRGEESIQFINREVNTYQHDLLCAMAIVEVARMVRTILNEEARKITAEYNCVDLLRYWQHQYSSAAKDCSFDMTLLFARVSTLLLRATQLPLHFEYGWIVSYQKPKTT